MACKNCKERTVYVDISGKPLCASHFRQLYEKKILKTIRKFRLIEKGDKLLMPVDINYCSLALLHFLEKYCAQRRIELQIKRGKGASLSGFTKLVRADCLDKIAGMIIENFLQKSPNWDGCFPKNKIKSQNGKKHGKELIEIRPLYFISEKESELYCKLNKIKVNKIKGKIKGEKAQNKFPNLLAEVEAKHRGTMNAIVNTFLKISGFLSAK